MIKFKPVRTAVIGCGAISARYLNNCMRRLKILDIVGCSDIKPERSAARASDYGFNTLNLHNIMLSVSADNLEGIACYTKSGFREVGRWREWVYKNGKYTDVIYMSILSREFEDKRRL